jgi:hypothetical protein
MRYLPLTAAIGLLAMPMTAGLASAQDDIDIGGMSCAEAAQELSRIVEENEVQYEEERALLNSVAGARELCAEQDDRTRLQELAARFEDRRWINNQGRFE